MKQLDAEGAKSFLASLPLSLAEKLAALKSLGLEPTVQVLAQVFRLNNKNSQGQTVLHYLASAKKTQLLKAFLSTVFAEGKEPLIPFDLNEPESTRRSFMQLLLEKELLADFEELGSRYA